MNLGSTSWRLECIQLWIYQALRTLVKSQMANMSPSTWCAPVGCWGNNDHSPFEGIGAEDASQITTDIMAEEVQSLRLAYEYATGRQLTCKVQ